MDDNFLKIDFIQTSDDLFDSIDGEVEESEENLEEQEGDSTSKNAVKNTTEDHADEGSESVGSEGNGNGDESTATQDDSSPNHISSIADALRDGGVFRTLTKEDIDSIVDESTFSNAIEREAQNRLDEQQKRIVEALDHNVPVDKIKYFENTIKVLNDITDESLRDESDGAENKRKNIIYQNYINKGIPHKEAAKLATLSVESDEGGMEEACEALEECREFFNKQYADTIKKAKDADAKREQEIKRRQESIKKSIMETSEFLNSLDVSDAMRKKIYDNVSKPVHKLEDGTPQTEIQKYISEHPEDFWTNVSALMTITDFFTNYDSLVNKPLKNAMKKSNDKLKNVLNTTKINDDGTLKYQRGVSVDDDSDFDISEWGISGGLSSSD